MKLKLKRNTFYATILIVLIIALMAYKYNTNPESSENLITGAAVVCDAPYIRHGESCCIDADSNKICDKDENIVEYSEEGLEEGYPPVKIKSAKLQGNQLKLDGMNTAEANAGEKLKVEVVIEAEDNTENLEIEVQVSGADNSNTVSAKAILPNVEKGVTYSKIVYPLLPEGIDDGYYKLSVFIAGNTQGKIMEEYRLKQVEAPHLITFNDFRFNPVQVKGGENTTAIIKVQNIGQMEEYVKFSVSIPYLNAGSYMNLENLEKWWDDTVEINVEIPEKDDLDTERCSSKNGIKTCDYIATMKVWYDYNAKEKKYEASLWKTAPLQIVFE
jgi:hypothetical protein